MNSHSVTGAEPRRKRRLNDPTPCEVCGKTVARYSMHKHLNIHTRKRVYPCRACGREFLEAGQREVHERIHNGRKPHSCEKCGKAFAQLGNLRVHRRRYHHLTDKPPKEKAVAAAKKEKILTSSNNSKRELRPVVEESTEAVSDSVDGQAKEQIIFVINKTLRGGNEYQPPTSSGHLVLELVEDSAVSGNQELENRCNELITETGGPKSEETVSSEDNCDGEEAEESSEGDNSLVSVPTDSEKKAPSPEDSTTLSSGCHTIREFVHMATQWITTRAKESQLPCPEQGTVEQENQENDLEEEVVSAENTELPRGEESNKFQSEVADSEGIKAKREWIKEAKQEVWAKLMLQIGNDAAVKKVLKKMPRGKGDETMRLLRRLAKVPANSVVARDVNGTLKWRCWDCSVQFASRHLLLRHRLKHAPPHLRPYCCPLCSRTFTQSGNLHHHLLVHRGEHRFTCEQCGALFRHKSHLTTHKRQHDEIPVVARFHCATCGKASSSRFHLIQHIRTHTLERPHQCQICGKKFAASSTYERHLKTHETSTETCFVCGQTFTDSSSRRRHQASHDMRKRHPCSCGRSFTQLFSLRRHAPLCSKASVPPVKSFQCPLCLKAFFEATGLKRHIATHDTVRTFTCHHCNRLLKTRETLQRHVRRQHSDQLAT